MMRIPLNLKTQCFKKLMEMLHDEQYQIKKTIRFMDDTLFLNLHVEKEKNQNDTKGDTYSK